MSRLIVEATTNQKRLMQPHLLQICVSVSHADTGAPVIGLSKNNFKITNLLPQVQLKPNDPITDYFLSVTERTWDPSDNQPSGVYDMIIEMGQGPFADLHIFSSGENYSFGLQVSWSHKIKNQLGVELTATDFGQTLVSVFNINEAI